MVDPESKPNPALCNITSGGLHPQLGWLQQVIWRGIKPFTVIFLFPLSGVVSADICGTALVVDGDTIAISGMKVHLSGIDTPEKKQTCRKVGATWRCGYEATKL